MSFWNRYPYTDFHEINLDWIIGILKEMEKKLEDFVATNSIKYANPFQWSIVNQYEKNTLVIEPNSGTAYLSVQAVPQGVAISNTDYWTPVFDLSQLVLGFNDNITSNNEQLNLVSSVNYAVGQWVIWNNKLYVVTAPITAGDMLVEGVNLTATTVEDRINAVVTVINNNIDTINNEILAINGDITTLFSRCPVFNTLNELIASDLTAGREAVTVFNEVPVTWNIKSSVSANDYYLTINSGLYAVLPKSKVHVKGIITMSADCSSIVNDLIAKGYDIYFDDGTYYANIVIPTGLNGPSIEGSSSVNAVIEPATNGPIISITNGMYVRIAHLRLQSMIHFATWTSAQGILTTGLSKCMFEDIVMENTHGGFKNVDGGVLWCTFKNVRVYGCNGIAFWLQASTAGGQINNNVFIACEVTVCSRFGYYFYDGARHQSWGNALIGCTCESTSSDIGPFSGQTADDAIFSSCQLVLRDCYIENCKGASFVQNLYRLVVDGCSFINMAIPLFNNGGAFDQAVIMNSSGYSVTGSLLKAGSGAMTANTNNVGLPA